MQPHARKRPRKSDEGNTVTPCGNNIKNSSNITGSNRNGGSRFPLRRPPLASNATNAICVASSASSSAPAVANAKDLFWQCKTAAVQKQLLHLASLYAQKTQENEEVLDAIEDMIADHEEELARISAESEASTNEYIEALKELRHREDASLAEKQRALDEVAMLQGKRVEMEQARERLQEDIVIQTDALEQLQATLETEQKVTEEEEKKLNHVLEREHAMQDVTFGLSGEVKEMVIELEQVRKAKETTEHAVKEIELLRRQLYSQCEELKGTIRVYCRVKGENNNNNNNNNNNSGNNNGEVVPVSDNYREASVSSRSTISLSTEGPQGQTAPGGKHGDGNRQKRQGGQDKTQSSRFVFPHAKDGVQRTLCVYQSRKNATMTGMQESKESFTYDRVYDGTATQETLYADVEPLVNCAIDGYRVCIFAYGPTGSGKTYSMEGDVCDEQKCGITPRALRTIFRRKEELKADGWKYNLRCYFIEIYNDVIRDMQQDPAMYEPGGAAASQANYHVIKHNNDSGSTSITNVVEKHICSFEQFQDHYKAAMKNRSTAKTLLNDHSSRSHGVFVLHIEGENNLLRRRSEGTLCLVDLAGSERVNESGTGQGQHFKETININRSLLDLGKCISALNNPGSVAPWRNCKLTYMLQNYLGAKGGKMLMLVTVSDKEEHISESLNSLRFASRVNQTLMGPSVKRVSNY